MRGLTRARLQGADLHTVLVVDLGSGGRRAYSDAHLVTPEGMVILPGLEEPEWAAELGGDSQGAAIRIVSPETWAELVRGLSGASGRLSIWAEGEPWADRLDLVVGYLDAPTYGAPEEEVASTISVATWEDAGLLPRPTWQVGAATWPRSSSALACPADLHGPYYPVVLGSPGAQRSAAEELDWYPIPALIVEIDDSVDPPDNSAADCTVLLGYGRLTCAGSTVELYNENTGGGAVVSAVATTDLLGTPCTVASVAAADLPIAAGDSLWWRPVAGTTVGLPGTGQMGQGLRWVASWSSVPQDPEGWSCTGDLDRLALDAVINEPISPMSWILDGPLKLLPCWLIEGAGGVGLAMMPLSPQFDCAEELDVEALGGWREDAVQTRSWTELRPGLVVEYGPDTRQSRHRRRIVIDPLVQAPSAEVADTARGRTIAARYQSMAMAVESVAADWLCNAGTADQVATYRHRELTDQWEEISIVLPQGVQLEVGQVWLLTVTDIRWNRRPCYVRSAPKIPGPVKYLLRTIEDL